MFWGIFNAYKNDILIFQFISFKQIQELSLFVPDKWSPALQIRTVLLSIQALLSAPNPDDPLANDVAEQWKVNESQAIQTGKQIGVTGVIMSVYKATGIHCKSKYVKC